MTRQELIDFCLTFPGAYEDYPFDAQGDPKAWAVMRHVGNKKTFALIYDRDGLCINLKCEPGRGDFFRQIYESVTPGYHMNKEHWNTVHLPGDVPEEELFAMVEHSYELICPKRKARRTGKTET